MYILLFAIKSYTWWIDLHQVKFMLDAFLIDVTASACSGGGGERCTFIHESCLALASPS